MPTNTQTKPHAQVYDVGRIVKEYTVTYLQPEPNLATPLNLAILLEQLQSLTNLLEQADEQRRIDAGTGGVVPCIREDGRALDALCLDLTRWRRRLDEYTMHTISIPAEQSHDRSAVLWEVTAPLFLGFHGGRTGTELPLVEGGFPPGFDPTVQHGPDLATPYSLANQLGVYVDFELENSDLGEGEETTFDLATVILIGFGLVAGVRWLTRRKK